MERVVRGQAVISRWETHLLQKCEELERDRAQGWCREVRERRGWPLQVSRGDGGQLAQARWKLMYAFLFPRVRGANGTRLGILGGLTSVLQERCLRLSPKQYLPPIVGLEMGVDGKEMGQGE